MEIKLAIMRRDEDVDINLVDLWYKSNYWTTSSKALGEITTGPFTYFPKHRRAMLWDGAGSVILEIFDLDYPPRPNSINGDRAKGRAYHFALQKRLSTGKHRWYHEKTEDPK